MNCNVRELDPQVLMPALLALLEETGADVHCAKDGDLTVYSDGTNVWTD